MSNLTIVIPTGGDAITAQRAKLALDSLKGKVVGFIDNRKPNFDFLVDDLAELLVAKYGVSKVIKRRKRVSSYPAPEEVIRELAAEADLVITGSGD